MIDILMASYNGEKYIAEQIDSILNQSHTDWKLYINDDCSTDNTAEIVKSYAEKYPDKIFFSQNSENSGSAGSNFFKMIEKSSADIIMTCDQDDIWLKDKVKTVYEVLKNEKKPMLVHTDLKTIDEKGRVISSSMIKSQKIDVTRKNTNQLIVQNIVTGCTMAFNRALADIIKTPENQALHDWYIAVVASMFGEIKYIDEATILYRQHSNNYCGAVDMTDSQYIKQRFKDKAKGKYVFKLSYNMAGEIIRLYDCNNEMLKEYSQMENFSKLKKLRVILKYKIWKCGLIRKLGQIYFM